MWKAIPVNEGGLTPGQCLGRAPLAMPLPDGSLDGVPAGLV